MPQSNAKMLIAGSTTAIRQIYMQDIIVVTTAYISEYSNMKT